MFIPIEVSIVAGKALHVHALKVTWKVRITSYPGIQGFGGFMHQWAALMRKKRPDADFRFGKIHPRIWCQRQNWSVSHPPPPEQNNPVAQRNTVHAEPACQLLADNSVTQRADALRKIYQTDLKMKRGWKEKEGFELFCLPWHCKHVTAMCPAMWGLAVHTLWCQFWKDTLCILSRQQAATQPQTAGRQWATSWWTMLSIKQQCLQRSRTDEFD